MAGPHEIGDIAFAAATRAGVSSIPVDDADIVAARAFAEKFVADSPDLDVKGFEPDGSSPALRSVLVHMIEEYARHCGHADLLRERIDGRIGQ